MKKKILALLSAAAMTVTALAVPFTASAEEVFADVKTVFSSDENTEWILHEQYGGMSAKVGETTLDSKNDKATGDSITLTIPEAYKGESDGIYKPIQVRPNIGSTIALENGVTYDFTVDYTANIDSYSDGTLKDNAVYAAFISRDSDSKEAGVAKDQYGVKVNDEDNKTSSGKITGHFTPTKDNCSLEIQLYLRHAYGSVTFSNLKVTTTSAPEEAVVEVNGRYFTDVIGALKVVENKGTIELLKTSTLSERALLDKLGNKSAKEITINGNDYTLNAPDNTMAIEVPNGYNLTIKDATVVGGNNYTINVKRGGTLKLDNATIGSTEGNAKPAINIAGTVNATNSSKINSILFESTSNNPVVNLDASSTLTGTIKPQNSTVTITENYALITGNVANCTAVYSNSNDAYKDIELKDGVFVKKPTTPTGTITMNAEYIGSYEGDEDGSTAAAYTAEFTANSNNMGFNPSGVTWKLGDDTLTFKSTTDGDTQITIDEGTTVTYGIIINGVFYNSADDAKTLSASFSN